MPIAAQCKSCSTKLKVRDNLAGKRVKCPKCSEPLSIPGGKSPAKPAAQAAAKPAAKPQQAPPKKAAAKPPAADGGYNLAPAHNPMLDLLDDAGVESAPRGPICNNCGCDLSPLAIICVECGFNNDTGKQLETTVAGKTDQAGMSETDKMMARAEEEIDESPISAAQQDFGDGADSIVIAVVAVIGTLILVAIGVGVIYLMDKVGENINTPLISMFGSIAMYIFCATWIMTVAFRAKAAHGLGCLFSGGLYGIVFGFMQGRALLLPTLICIFSIFIGLLSGWMAGFEEDAMLQTIQIITTV